MRTATKRKPDRHAGDVDVFLAFQTRVQSLDFAKREALRCKADAGELMALMAAPAETRDPYLRERARAAWEELLDEALDKYRAAHAKLCWELEDAGMV